MPAGEDAYQKLRDQIMELEKKLAETPQSLIHNFVMGLNAKLADQHRQLTMENIQLKARIIELKRSQSHQRGIMDIDSDAAG